MSATVFNTRIGGYGRNMAYADVTLAAGTGTVSSTFNTVESVQITQKGAAATAEGLSWSASGGTVTVDSSDGASTTECSLLIIGY